MSNLTRLEMNPLVRRPSLDRLLFAAAVALLLVLRAAVWCPHVSARLFSEQEVVDSAARALGLDVVQPRELRCAGL